MLLIVYPRFKQGQVQSVGPEGTGTRLPLGGAWTQRQLPGGLGNTVRLHTWYANRNTTPTSYAPQTSSVNASWW